MEKWQRVIWGVSSFLFCFVLFFKLPTRDPDLGWHFKNAEGVLVRHRFPWADSYSWTMPGYAYTDSWWLTEVLFRVIGGLGGFGGLAAICSFLPAVLLTAFFLLKSPKISSSWIGTAAFILVAIMICPFLGTRAQTITVIFFAVLYLALGRWRKRRLKAPDFLLLFAFFLLWANLHAGFVFGLFLLAISLVEPLFLLLRQLIAWRPIQPVFKKMLPSFLFFLPALLATFLNPYGVFLWRTILNDASSPLIKSNIVEWLPTTLRDELGLVFFMVLLGTAALLLIKKRVKIDSFELLAFFLFAFLAIASVRNIPFFAIIAASIILKVIPSLSEKRFPPWPFLHLYLFLLFILFAFYNGQEFSGLASWEKMTKRSKLPRAAVEYLKQNPKPNLRLFNEYGWGGYLIWQSDIKTFIDGRMCGWKTKEVNIFEDFLQISSLKKDFPEKIEKWDINAFLIEKDSPLAAWLSLNQKFKKTHEDDLAVVFEK